MLLHVLRHAEAEALSPSGLDADRALTEAGTKRMKAVARAIARMEPARESILRGIRSFQLPLYCRFAGERHPGVPVRAELVDLRDCSRKPFPKDPSAFDEAMARCNEALERILCEIADPAVPFAASEGRWCSWCPFTAMCR